MPERGAYRCKTGRKPRRRDNLYWNMGPALEAALDSLEKRAAEKEARAQAARRAGEKQDGGENKL